jgi:hypothetical protein
MRDGVKIRMHIVIVKPALQCGNATWVLREDDKRTMEITEMRFLRPRLNISQGDKIASTVIKTIRNRANGEGDARIYKTNGKSHRKMTSCDCLTWQAHFCYPTGIRNVGCTRKRWTQFL